VPDPWGEIMPFGIPRGPIGASRNKASCDFWLEIGVRSRGTATGLEVREPVADREGRGRF